MYKHIQYILFYCSYIMISHILQDRFTYTKSVVRLYRCKWINHGIWAKSTGTNINCMSDKLVELAPGHGDQMKWVSYQWPHVTVMVSQMSGASSVCSTACLNQQQRKHTNSHYWAFVKGIHPPKVNSSHKWAVIWKAFPRCCLIMSLASQALCLFEIMMTSSNGNIFRVTGHLCGKFTGPGEFPAQRPVTLSFDVCFDLRLNKRLSKQS